VGDERERKRELTSRNNAVEKSGNVNKNKIIIGRGWFLCSTILSPLLLCSLWRYPRGIREVTENRCPGGKRRYNEVVLTEQRVTFLNFYDQQISYRKATICCIFLLFRNKKYPLEIS